MKRLIIIMVMIVLAGCEAGLYEPAPVYEPVQPNPTTPVDRTPDVLVFKKGVCSQACRDMIEAGKIVNSKKSEKILKEDFAMASGLTAHEQVHLVDIALASLSVRDAADVMTRLAKNPTLTKEAYRHLKIMSDKLLAEDEKELLKILKQNPK